MLACNWNKNAKDFITNAINSSAFQYYKYNKFEWITVGITNTNLIKEEMDR